MFYPKNTKITKHYILKLMAVMNTICCVYDAIFTSGAGCFIKKKYFYSAKYAIHCLIFGDTFIKKHQNPLCHEIIKP